LKGFKSKNLKIDSNTLPLLEAVGTSLLSGGRIIAKPNLRTLSKIKILKSGIPVADLLQAFFDL
jgi:hypothetical protein